MIVDYNYGLLKFDLSKEPTMKVQIKGTDNLTHLEKQLSLDDFTFMAGLKSE